MALLKEGDMIYRRQPNIGFHNVTIVRVKGSPMRISHGQIFRYWHESKVCEVWGQFMYLNKPMRTLVTISKEYDEEAFAIVRNESVRTIVAKCKRWVHSIKAKRIQTLMLCGHRLGWPELPEDIWRTHIRPRVHLEP